MKNKKQTPSLFDEQLFNEINEVDVVFPLFFKDRYETRYTFYLDAQRFEEITINETNQSLRGSILFGFNEQIIQLQGDLKTWFYINFRNQTQITKQEYDEVFEKLIKSRESFLSEENDFKYMPRELNEQQKNVKHKYPK